MFSYAKTFYVEPRVAEGYQVDGIDIVLDVADEFYGQALETKGLSASLSKSKTYHRHP